MTQYNLVNNVSEESDAFIFRAKDVTTYQTTRCHNPEDQNATLS
jgi:hypothetical protein